MLIMVLVLFGFCYFVVFNEFLNIMVCKELIDIINLIIVLCFKV